MSGAARTATPLLCYDRVASESDSKSRVLVTEQSRYLLKKKKKTTFDQYQVRKTVRSRLDSVAFLTYLLTFDQVIREKPGEPGHRPKHRQRFCVGPPWRLLFFAKVVLLLLFAPTSFGSAHREAEADDDAAEEEAELQTAMVKDARADRPTRPLPMFRCPGSPVFFCESSLFGRNHSTLQRGMLHTAAEGGTATEGDRGGGGDGDGADELGLH